MNENKEHPTDFRLQIRILMNRKNVTAAKLSRIADLNPSTIQISL